MRTYSADGTRQLGEKLAGQLRAGDVVLLRGDLGSGKSELTRGLARGLGVKESVTSPSFTILNVYESGRIPLYHFDWYRLESEEELYELGMDESLGGDGIAAVEWPEQCGNAVPEDALEIRMAYVDDTTRDITLQRLGQFHEIDGIEEDP